MRHSKAHKPTGGKGRHARQQDAEGDTQGSRTQRETRTRKERAKIRKEKHT